VTHTNALAKAGTRRRGVLVEDGGGKEGRVLAVVDHGTWLWDENAKGFSDGDENGEEMERESLSQESEGLSILELRLFCALVWWRERGGLDRERRF